MSDLARQAYGLVASEPFYAMWDVTAAVWLSRPELYAPATPMRLRIDTSENRTGAHGA